MFKIDKISLEEEKKENPENMGLIWIVFSKIGYIIFIKNPEGGRWNFLFKEGRFQKWDAIPGHFGPLKALLGLASSPYDTSTVGK